MKIGRAIAVLLWCAVAATRKDLDESFEPAECGSLDVSCVGLNWQCSFDLVRDADKCENAETPCCSFPYYCLGGRCMEDNTGAECKTDSDCLERFYGTGVHQCVEGVCRMVGNVGDACVATADCMGDMECVDGVCVGKKEGETCVESARSEAFGEYWGEVGFMCAEGLACVDGVCAATAKLGENCAAKKCDRGLACVKDVCVAHYSLSEGETCDGEAQCSVGLKCVEGICFSATELTWHECTLDSECDAEETTGVCSECSHPLKQGYCGMLDTATGCDAEKKAAEECYIENGCSPHASPDSTVCGQRLCAVETEAVLACELNCLKMRKMYGEACVAADIIDRCPVMATWAKMLIAFAIVFAVVGAAFAVYGICRLVSKKRSGYEPIPTSVN